MAIGTQATTKMNWAIMNLKIREASSEYFLSWKPVISTLQVNIYICRYGSY
jgi:hypothetical protein